MYTASGKTRATLHYLYFVRDMKDNYFSNYSETKSSWRIEIVISGCQYYQLWFLHHYTVYQLQRLWTHDNINI